MIDLPCETGRGSTVAFSNVHTSQDTWKRVVKTGPCSAEDTWGGEEEAGPLASLVFIPFGFLHSDP